MTGVTTGDLKAFQLQTKLNLNANVILDLVQMVSVAQTGCHVSLKESFHIINKISQTLIQFFFKQGAQWATSLA